MTGFLGFSCSLKLLKILVSSCQIQTDAINVYSFNILVLLSCLAWLLCFFFLQGYGGGDEVNMLRRHLLGTPTKFGVGANRAAVASRFIQKYGYVDIGKSSWHEKQYLDEKVQDSVDSEKIGVVVLDDAMQVMQLFSTCFFFYFFVDILFHDFLLNDDPWSWKHLVPLLRSAPIVMFIFISLANALLLVTQMFEIKIFLPVYGICSKPYLFARKVALELVARFGYCNG